MDVELRRRQLQDVELAPDEAELAGIGRLVAAELVVLANEELPVEKVAEVADDADAPDDADAVAPAERESIWPGRSRLASCLSTASGPWRSQRTSALIVQHLRITRRA